MKKLLFITGITAVISIVIIYCSAGVDDQPTAAVASQPDSLWRVPDTAFITHDEAGDRIRYGRELVVHTSYYLGPKGRVAHLSNGMNCENCHLEAGTRLWGSNFSAAAANYPKYHPRSNSVQTLLRKVNDCFERSLNGHPPDSASKEMQAIISYIKWLGKDVARGKLPAGAGIRELPYLTRPADSVKGSVLYMHKCASCHSADGEGMWSEAEQRYIFPPLWGAHSYNCGASMFRLTKFAGYVKDNMPFNNKRSLSDEECWDLAAYVNSRPRPVKDVSKDWPLISKKPFDYPFGPYADTFSEQRHKFGPYTHP